MVSREAEAGASARTPRSRAVTLVAVGLAALGGVAVEVSATRQGVGLSKDSVAYLQAAESLQAGRGVWVYSRLGEPMALTQYPPLYPLVLAGVGWTGAAPAAAARFVNLVLFAATVFLVGLAIERQTRTVVAPVAGALFAAFSPVMLLVHSYMWSEPLYLVWHVASVALLAWHVERRSWVRLGAAAVAAALACLTRYPGASLVAAGAAGVVLLGRARLRRRLAEAAVFAALAGGPMAAWFGRNAHHTRRAAAHAIVFHPAALRRLWGGPLEFGRWLFPGDVRGDARWYVVCGLAFLLALVMAGVLVGAVVRRRGERPHGALPALVALATAAYVGVFVVALAVYDARVGLDRRLLSPVYVMLVMFLASTVGGALRRSARRWWVTGAVVLAGTYLLALHLSAGVRWAAKAGREGQGFALPRWRASETMRVLAAVPAGTTIFTYDTAAVYLHTGRVAVLLPTTFDLNTGQGNTALAAHLARLRERLARSGGVVACFEARAAGQPYLPEEDLKRYLNLRLRDALADGRIYVADPARLATTSAQAPTRIPGR